MSSDVRTAPAPGAKPGGNYRWVVLALIFFATTINYIDRQVIGILKPFIADDLGWSEHDYSNIVTAFQLAYAIGLLTMGRVMDWLGTKKGFSLALIFWSLAAMAHAAANGVGGFIAARFALGLGEAGNFPAAIKTVAEWFPKKERALATGLFNAGTNVGATIAPLIVPMIMAAWGWRAAFIVTGAIGFLWLLFWIPLYHKPEEHPRLSKSELAYISSDPPDPETKIPLLKIITYKQAWAFAIAKFMTDPIWWLYLFWVPDFLYKTHGVDIKAIRWPLIAIYLIADFGSIGGGWISSALLKRGATVNRARKTAMLVCALCVLPIMICSQIASLWPAVLIIALAAAAHQGWSANVFTMTSDMFPRKAVGSVVGFGGMAGAIGGMLISQVVGYVLDLTGSYFIPFLIAGTAYLIALLVVHLIVPKMEPADI